MPDDLPWALNDELAKTKYSAAQLYRFLARSEPPHDRDVQWDYSNIGYTLLGQALAPVQISRPFFEPVSSPHSN